MAEEIGVTISLPALFIVSLTFLYSSASIENVTLAVRILPLVGHVQVERTS